MYESSSELVFIRLDCHIGISTKAIGIIALTQLF